MAGPITWRNVDAPNLGDPSRTLAMAQGSFNSVFDAFNEQLKRLETTDANNWQVQKQLNTEDQLNWLSQFKTPEEAQAALASGELQNRLAQAGGQIDAKAVRQAEQALIPELQRRVVLDQQFQDQKSDLSERDAVGNIRTLIAAGKFKDAGSAIQSAGVRAGTAATLQRELLEASRGEQRFGWEAEDQRRQNMEFQLRQKESNARMAQLKREQDKVKWMDLLKVQEAKLGADAAVAQKAMGQSYFRGKPASDLESQAQIAEVLKTTGIGAADIGTNPSNFVDRLIKASMKSKSGDRLIAADGKSLNLSITDPKTNKPQTIQVPLTAELLTAAIQRANGAVLDPTINSVSKELRAIVKTPEFAAAALQYKLGEGAMVEVETARQQALQQMIDRMSPR